MHVGIAAVVDWVTGTSYVSSHTLSATDDVHKSQIVFNLEGEPK